MLSMRECYVRSWLARHEAGGERLTREGARHEDGGDRPTREGGRYREGGKTKLARSKTFSTFLIPSEVGK